MEPISGTLREMLVRQGLRRRTVGAESLDGKKEPGAADESARRQLPAQGGAGGMGMITSKWRTIRARPLLAIIDGGLA